MAPTLYMTYASPPVRAVLITAKAIGLDLTLKEVNLLAGENKTPEYLKLNPQHTIPTLVEDDGFVVWDSHAITAYLVSKYAKGDSLYPKNLKKRAVIDQRLHFESGVVFASLAQAFRPVLYDGKTSIAETHQDTVKEGYEFLEAFLDGKEWVAGDSVTIADYSLITSISSLNVLVPIDRQNLPRVAAWVKRVEQLPEYEANVKGLKDFVGLAESRLKKA